MDLDEFLFYEKKKDPTLTTKKFAEKLDVGVDTLRRILKKQRSPAGIAHKVWEVSKGKVDIGKMMVSYFQANSKN